MIFAWPERCAADCDSAAARQAIEDRRSQIAAVEAGLPAARLVRIPDADHYVFRSHEAEVLREMSAFLKDLQPK